MRTLICDACGVSLANSQGPTSQVGGFYWLEAGEYKTRICLCTDCTIPKLATKSVWQWAKNIVPKAQWDTLITVTPACNLEEWLILANGNNCTECGKSLLDEPKIYRDGWKLYHPKCRGQFHGIRKKERRQEGGSDAETGPETGV